MRISSLSPSFLPGQNLTKSGGVQAGPGPVPPMKTRRSPTLPNSTSSFFKKNEAGAGAKVGAREQLSPTDLALREQTDAFEAFFIKQILDISLAKSNELFGKDASDEIYASMYNDTLSKALSGGLGFSQLLFDFLRERA